MINEDDFHTPTSELINISGGQFEAVQNIGHFIRALSKTLLYSDRPIERVDELNKEKRIKKSSKINATVNQKDFISALNSNLGNLKHQQELSELFKQCRVIWPYPDQNITKIRLAELRLMDFLRNTFKNSIDESVLKFYAKKQIRLHYQVVLSPTTARFFNILCELLSKKLSEEKIEQLDKKYSSEIIYLDIKGENGVYQLVSSAIEKEIIPHFSCGSQFEPSELAEFFFEVCQFVNYINPVIETDRRKSKNILTKFQFRTTKLDAEFLLSNIFGTSTGDAGLDNLFGGAGPIFPERLPISTEIGSSPFYKNNIGGRIVVIVGPRGSGKTLLATKIAASVSQNSGVSWIMPLEQDVNDSLFMLETTNTHSQYNSLNIATDLYSTTNALKKISPSAGALIIMNSDIESYPDFLEVLLSTTKSMTHDTTHLIVMDPVNTIPLSYTEGTEDNTGDLRQQTISSISQLKRQGINVLLVLEKCSVVHPKDTDGRLEFLERIADTVIELSVQEDQKYAQRQIEITKSRLQREQRGKHAFSIVPGKGLQIYPSSNAVLARVRGQAPIKPNQEILFGFSDIDRMMGQKSIFKGDIIAFSGPGGIFKTELALIFLLAKDKRHRGISKGGQISILFANRDTQNSLSFLLDQPFMQNTLQHVSDSHNMSVLPQPALKIIELPQGNVDPGKLLLIIEKTVLDYRKLDYEVNRIVIDDTSEWHQSSPAIRDDDTFVAALTRLLRGFKSTCLFVSSIKPSVYSSLHRSIVENADCVLKFDRFWFHGVKQITVRVAKSRGRQHRMETYGICIEDNRIRINPLSSLIRVDRYTGTTSAIGVRILCYVEGANQRKYYDSLVMILRSILVEDIQINHHSRLYFNRGIGLSRESSLDQLQIIQLEEWQLELYLGSGYKTIGQLVTFEEFETKRNLLDTYTKGFRIQDIITRKKKTKSKKKSHQFKEEPESYVRYNALPYSYSISLLAYRSEDVAQDTVNSWLTIAEQVRAWEQNDTKQQQIFFDFPKGSRHDYIALYFEILLSLAGRPIVEPKNTSLCSIRTWLTMPQAIEAAIILRQICHRSHQKHLRKFANSREEYKFADCEVDISAKIWRHTYSTCIQMLDDINVKSSLKNIILSQLPNGISIAGDSYLAIPIYSATSDTGAEIIEMLTSSGAEQRRLRKGIGLPTRKSFYMQNKVSHFNPLIKGLNDNNQMKISDVSKLMERAFRRSDFRCYHQITSVVARSLISVIEVPNSGVEDEHKIRSKVNYIISDLSNMLDSLQENMFDKNIDSQQLIFSADFCFDCRHKFSCKQS